MLYVLDHLLTFLQFGITVFNFLAGQHLKTRKAHLLIIIVTTFSWFLLGVWYSLGYCPFTDWQRQVKEKLGETKLPNSFIKYYFDKISHQNINAGQVDLITGVCFAFSLFMAVHTNFMNTSKNKVLNIS